MSSRNGGMTLLELMIALAVGGGLLAVAAGTASRWADRAKVELAAGQVLDAYRRTRSVARAWGRPAELLVSPDSLIVRAIWQAETTEVWRGPGPAAAGVGITPVNHTAVFLPSGAAGGLANTTHVLARGTARRSVVVSRLGRVRVR